MQSGLIAGAILMGKNGTDGVYTADPKLDPDAEFPNAFRAQWELFIRHVVGGDPFPWTLREGARGVQLAELGLQASESRTWVDVEPL